MKYLISLTMIGVCLTADHAQAQGSLTPPGAPGPTMKTLSQIEPRMAITYAPYTIVQSGSYYLASNLTSSTHGIVIRASDVTVDLMGFSLAGDQGSADLGIWLDGSSNAVLKNIVVQGGGVRNFGCGILIDNTYQGRVENMFVSGCGSDGIRLDNECEGVAVVNSTFSGNGLVDVNDTAGINLGGINPGGRCEGNVVRDCVASGNSKFGILLTGNHGGLCSGNAVWNCVVFGNGSWGINITGFQGQCEGNVVADCVVRKNNSPGIYLAYTTGNRIEHNHVTGSIGVSTTGIHCLTGVDNNLFLQNTCVGQTNNYNIASGNTYGPIVTNTGALSSSNGMAAASPWVNFSR